MFHIPKPEQKLAFRINRITIGAIRAEVTKLVEWKKYLKSLIQWKDKAVIKVVTGIRRCGKSTLLMQYQFWLLRNGVSETQIISINFEELEYEELQDYRKLYAYLKERLVPDGNHIRAHFLTCFIDLMICRILEKKLKEAFTCEEIIDALKNMWVARPGEKLGYMSFYTRINLMDTLHETAGFRTDYQIISDVNMHKVIRASKTKNNNI